MPRITPMLIDKNYISVRFIESQIKKRNKALSIILDMSNFLSASLELEEMLRGALARIIESFAFSAGRIYLMDESSQYLNLVAHQGMEAQGLEKVRISEGFTGKAARTRSFIAQYVAQLEDEERAALLASKGFKIIICVPLIAADNLIGVMNLATKGSSSFKESEIDLLVALGNQIAVAVNNAQLHEDLLGKVKELKIQKDAIEFFAYSISHDLKSPAVGIYGLTSRLYQHYLDKLDDKGKLYCEQILKASEQVARLVDRINAYIMAKESRLVFEETPFHEITETIRNEFSDALNKRSIKWTEPDELPTLFADKLSLLRMLRNLVDNALKYGGQGLTEVRIEYKNDPDFHIISVYDDGASLKAEECERLFQLFHRQKTSAGIEGTGLGLATVKEIAERHGGRVWLDAPSGIGTTFCIAIPKHPANSSETKS